jgi:hypothetical protein
LNKNILFHPELLKNTKIMQIFRSTTSSGEGIYEVFPHRYIDKLILKNSSPIRQLQFFHAIGFNIKSPKFISNAKI